MTEEQPKQVLECITEEREPLFWLSQKQLSALQNGYTHTDLRDKKSILQTIPDQKIRSRSYVNVPEHYEKLKEDHLVSRELLKEAKREILLLKEELRKQRAGES